MIIYPAMDIKQGHCVRLRQGDMKQSTVFHQNPVQQAEEFAQQGSCWLHLVDLDGAVQGSSVNGGVIRDIIESTDMQCQLGGGIRSMDSISYWLDLGVARVVLGTVAIESPDLARQAIARYGKRIAIALDSKNQQVALHGWKKESALSLIDSAKMWDESGAGALIYTDITRDGMLQGLDLEGLRTLAETVQTPVIASGGVACLQDIERLLALKQENIVGVILGRALYEKTVLLPEALNLACKGYA